MANGFCRNGAGCQKSMQNAEQCDIRATVSI